MVHLTIGIINFRYHYADEMLPEFVLEGNNYLYNFAWAE